MSLAPKYTLKITITNPLPGVWEYLAAHGTWHVDSGRATTEAAALSAGIMCLIRHKRNSVPELTVHAP